MSGGLSKGDVVGRYEILGPAPSSQQTAAWIVRHRVLHSRHLLRLMLLTGPPADRFLTEGRIQASLRHPNVHRVTDIFDWRGHPALVYEELDASTVDKLLEEGPLQLGHIQLILRDSLAALDAAHKRKMVHRNLTPSTILLHKTRDGFRAKITGFGMALVEGGSGTKAGERLSNSVYMSPELHDNPSFVDGRSDLFSLGAIVYEMLTGVVAFGHDDPGDIYDAIRTGVYPPMERRDAPTWLKDIVKSMLQPDPKDRPESAKKLLERVDRVKVAEEDTAETWRTKKAKEQERAAGLSGWFHRVLRGISGSDQDG